MLRFILFCLVACAPDAHAQDRIANGTRFDNWTVTCEAVAVGETLCALVQQIVNAQSQAPLAELVALTVRGEDQVLLSVRVPVGVWLPAAFTLRMTEDTAPVEMVWQACDGRICEAVLPLDAPMIARLNTGAPLLVAYIPALGAEPVVFEVGFAGLGAGLQALGTAQR
jgi:invasion protein IalB